MDMNKTINIDDSYGPAAPGRYYYQAGDQPLEGVTIKRAIGRGGFGEVYFAVTDAGKRIALKHITRAVEVERRGAAHCINLKSPNLVGLYDIKTNSEGASFVLMEYVSGPSLKEVIERHPSGLSDDDLRSYLSGLVTGVAELHAAGIVHRDLKPANIFVEEGIVKVGDYGLSKTITEVDRDHSVSVGTCHYMAPEIRTGRYDKPVDIYAIGVILYEMITGHTPFHGQTAAEVLMRHQFDRPDFSAIPQRYRSIVEKSLDKDPSRRPHDVREILHAVEKTNGSSGLWGDIRSNLGRVASPWMRDPAKDDASQNVSTVEPPADAKPQGFAGAANDSSWSNRFGMLLRGPQSEPLRRSTAQRQESKPTGLRGRFARARFSANEVVIEAPPWPEDHERQRSLLRAIGWTIVCSWLLASPEGFLVGVNMSDAPNRIAYVAVTSSLLTSLMLVLQNSWENWKVTTGRKRSVGFVSGAGLGIVAAVLATWLGIHQRPHNLEQTMPTLGAAFSEVLNSGQWFSYGLMGGLALSLPRWWRMVERDRPTRWSVGNLFRWGISCLVVSSIATSEFPLALAVFALTGVVAQFVGPWDKELADYAQLRQLAKRRFF
jgi:serine/threonine protein kinase